MAQHVRLLGGRRRPFRDAVRPFGEPAGGDGGPTLPGHDGGAHSGDIDRCPSRSSLGVARSGLGRFGFGTR